MQPRRSYEPGTRYPIRARILLLLCLTTPLTAAAPPADLALQLVVSGLDRPIELVHAGDDSGRLFVVEQAGVISIISGVQLLPTPFLDIMALVDDAANEQGLLGMTFHPDFSANGQFFVNYTRDLPSADDRTVIARYQVSSSDPDIADPSSATTILEISQDETNHNGGGIHFGSDGYLYIGMGDGGGGGDPRDRAQNTSSLLGKMLRIDVDKVAANGPDCGLQANYTVPADNPLADGTGGSCDEIWALGLRNPWRWSFDRFRGDLYIGDVGQNAVEEIDFEPLASGGGLNFGWPCYEGSQEFDLSGCAAAGSYTAPVFEFAQLAGSCGSGGSGSITGGYVYRGFHMAELQGIYVYGDFCSGRIWFGSKSGPTWTTDVWSTTLPFLTTFGEDQAGNLYAADIGGNVYLFVSPNTVFANDFEAGVLDSGWRPHPPLP